MLGAILHTTFTVMPAGQTAPTSFFDHFAGSSLDARWVPLVSGAATLKVSDSYAECLSPQPTDGCAFYHHTQIDKTRSQLFVLAVSNHSGAFPQWWLTLADSPAPPVADTFPNWDGKLRARISAAMARSTRAIAFDYWDGAHTRRRWDGRTAAWTSSGTANNPIAGDDYYLIAVEIDGASNRWRMMASGQRSTTGGYSFDQGLRLFSLTDWVSWSSMEPTNNLWLVVGEPLADYNAGTLRLEWARLDAGGKHDVWTNGRSEAGKPFVIKHGWGYESGNGGVEFIVQEDRVTLALANGPPGEWDELGVKDPFVFYDPADPLYYMFYAGSDAGGFQIGLATSSTPNGVFTKTGGPIIGRVSGTIEDQVFAPALVKDMQEADPSKRYKLLYTGYLNGDFRVLMATAQTLAGPWAKQGLVLDVGQQGQFDQNGYSRPRPVLADGLWYVFVSAKNVTEIGEPFRVTYATGSTLDQLVPSGNVLVDRGTGPAQNITAPLAGRLVKVADSSGFRADGYVLVDQDADPNQYGASRIRKVLDATTIELYHGLDGFTTATPAKVVQIDTAARIEVADVVRSGDYWHLHTTPFAFFSGYPPLDAYAENTGLLVSGQITGPYVWNHLATSQFAKGSWNNERSNENLTFVHLPTAAGPTDTTPPTITSVSVSNVGATFATITWLTDEPADSRVEYGLDTSYGAVTPLDPALVQNHSQTIAGLTPGTTYQYRVISRDVTGNTALSGNQVFTTSVDAEPPTVVVTSPSDGAMVAGTISVRADASDNAGVAGVQFTLDGASVGAEDTTQPYGFTLDTTALSNGPHSLAAIARDVAGNITTSAAVGVIVNNPLAVFFDGVDDALVGPNVSPPERLSLSVWIKPATLGENSTGHILAIRDDTDNDPNVQLRLLPNQRLRFFVAFDDAGSLTFGYWDTPVGSVRLNALQHVAVVYDGTSPTNAPSIYLDGQLQALVRGEAPSGRMRRQPAALIVGNNPAQSGTFHGIIEELRLYDRILSAAEISAHYNNGVVQPGQAELGLLAGWHFDQKAGTAALDYSGNGVTLNLVNGARWTVY